METIEILEHRYRELAEAHGAATLSGDYKRASKSHDALIATLLELRIHGSSYEAALKRLMADPNASVAGWAATHSLPFAEAEALAVLKGLSNGTGPVAFGAGIVIQQWNKGQLVLP